MVPKHAGPFFLGATVHFWGQSQDNPRGASRVHRSRAGQVSPALQRVPPSTKYQTEAPRCWMPIEVTGAVLAAGGVGWRTIGTRGAAGQRTDWGFQGYKR